MSDDSDQELGQRPGGTQGEDGESDDSSKQHHPPLPAKPNVKHWIQEEVVLPINHLHFDVQLKHGQARRMDPKWVAQLKDSFMLNPPITSPVMVTVWEMRSVPPLLRMCATAGWTPSFPGRAKYCVLGGQHSAAALCEIVADYRRAGKQVPEYYSTVRAVVMKRKTPFPIRQFIAGRAQQKQQTVKSVTVSDVARKILQGIRRAASHESLVVYEALVAAGVPPVGKYLPEGGAEEVREGVDDVRKRTEKAAQEEVGAPACPQPAIPSPFVCRSGPRC